MEIKITLKVNEEECGKAIENAKTDDAYVPYKNISEIYDVIKESIKNITDSFDLACFIDDNTNLFLLSDIEIEEAKTKKFFIKKPIKNA